MTTPSPPDRIGAGKRIGILTSGGDAQGMNAAVRGVVRTALSLGAEVFAILEGYQGMVDGGDAIRPFGWDDVSGIQNKGGTVIGTFRSADFRTREGRRRAAANLIDRGIDRLVVSGGDGSLSGLAAFATEWPELLAELVAAGELTQATADAHPRLRFAGIVGSIDNDLVGADMTIGADSALHRIGEAIDALTSTAASHQRSFVVEVMGRHCGYLPLAAALAGSCDYVLIPEEPPADGWEDRMCAELRRGRQAGRRDSLVVVAEGATDRTGRPITAEEVRGIIEERLGEEARVTILGHVQRGGTPSAFDRWVSTWLGYEAARQVLVADPEIDGPVVAYLGNRVRCLPLADAVADTRRVPELIDAGRYAEAMGLRSGDFAEMLAIFHELAEPAQIEVAAESRRIGVIHAGGLAPGMNAAALAAVRLGISRGHTMLGIHDGFPGLRDGKVAPLTWSDVEGWTGEAGAHLGLKRTVPTVEELYAISRALEEHRVDGLLVIGGWNAYRAAHLLYSERERYPAFRMPIVCVPASIDNNLPGSELSIGADSALNVILRAIDGIKQSAAATTRAFVVETMGRWCGYLALLSAIGAGAEKVYLHEDGVTLDRLVADTEWARRSFAQGRELLLALRNENASENYTTEVLANVYEEEGGDLFDVRTAVIGHQAQGGRPSPHDRLLAMRLVSHALNALDEAFDADPDERGRYVGLVGSAIRVEPLAGMMKQMDTTFRRPRTQWWLPLRDLVDACSVEPILDDPAAE